MSKLIRFTDAITGTASIKKDLGKDLKNIKDSASPSGKSLVAQIEMTHSGIVTRNMGFYLPDNMRKGAPSFTKNYKKPVLIGHDADTDPIGRVIQADYVDTSKQWTHNDKYLSSLMRFQDKKKNKKDSMVDFVQHVIGEYHGKDNYRGLGHILGTLKITDEDAIKKILDERYLTVSISTSSDAAYCSECGQDWVSEGLCEHERGEVYDSGVPVVLIPGSMSYNHVGFVSEPADEFAAGLKGIELIEDETVNKLDSVDKAEKKDFADKFSIAANLFSYQDSKLVSLSDESQTNLLEVKDSIQKLEDSLKTMETENMKKGKFADEVGACINLYLYGEDGESMNVEVRKYAENMSSEDLQALAKKASAALSSQDSLSKEELDKAVLDYLIKELSNEDASEEATTEDNNTEEKVMKKVKKLNDRMKLVADGEYEASLEDSILEEIQKIESVSLTDKEAKNLASLIARSQNDDALASLTLETKDKSTEEIVKDFVEVKDSMFKLSSVSEEELVEKMNDHISEEEKIVLDSVLAKECAGSGKYFPILNKACVDAAKKVLALTIASDAVKGGILENIEKIASKLPVEDAVAKEGSEENAPEGTENFDSTDAECDNLKELNDEALIAELTKLVQVASEREIIDQVIAPFMVDKEQEIGVLEQQLLLANDEIDSLLSSLTELKDKAKTQLAEKVVDAKINSGLFEISDRKSEIEKHLKRSEDSLNDALEDLVSSKVKKVEDKEQEERIADGEKIENPVLNDDAKDLNTQIVNDNKAKEEASKELKRKEVMRTYTLLKNNKGKTHADAWLNKQNL